MQILVPFQQLLITGLQSLVQETDGNSMVPMRDTAQATTNRMQKTVIQECLRMNWQVGCAAGEETYVSTES